MRGAARARGELIMTTVEMNTSCLVDNYRVSVRRGLRCDRCERPISPHDVRVIEHGFTVICTCGQALLEVERHETRSQGR
jgi:hypothetical protein